MKLSIFMESLLISTHFNVHLPVWLVSMDICLKGNLFHSPFLVHKSEVYSEPCQISKVELFAKILNGFQLLLSLLPKLFYKDAYLDPSRTFKTELFPKIFNSF